LAWGLDEIFQLGNGDTFLAVAKPDRLPVFHFSHGPFVCYSLAQLWTDWRDLFRRRDCLVPTPQQDTVPEISILVPAFNEETPLLQKAVTRARHNMPVFSAASAFFAPCELRETLKGVRAERLLRRTRNQLRKSDLLPIVSY
jgi:hypothetical protein